MKSYFAKLADRATIGTPPASLSMRAKQHRIVEDSSEQTKRESMPHPESVTRVIEPGSRSQSVSDPEDADLKIGRAETSAPLTSERRIEKVEVPVPSPTPATTPTAARYSEVTRIVKPINQEERLIPADTREPRQVEDADDESNLMFDSAKLEAIEQEQIDLLRRADEFMNDLLTLNRHADEPSPEFETSIDHQPEATTRLEPTPSSTSIVPPPPSRTAEHTEAPSLVIGKLSVEVTSPAPQQSQPGPVIVVQRFGNKSSAIPSSRRFGLGQF